MKWFAAGALVLLALGAGLWAAYDSEERDKSLGEHTRLYVGLLLVVNLSAALFLMYQVAMNICIGVPASGWWLAVPLGVCAAAGLGIWGVSQRKDLTKLSRTTLIVLLSFVGVLSIPVTRRLFTQTCLTRRLPRASWTPEI